MLHPVSWCYLLFPGATSCFLVLPPVSWCYLLFSGATSCFLVLPPVSWCYLLFPGATSCFLVLPPVSWCYLLFPGATSCFLVLPPVSWGYLLFPGATSCFLVLPPVSWCYLLFPGATSCFLVLPPISWCFLLTNVNLENMSLQTVFFMAGKYFLPESHHCCLITKLVAFLKTKAWNKRGWNCQEQSHHKKDYQPMSFSFAKINNSLFYLGFAIGGVCKGGGGLLHPIILFKYMDIKGILSLPNFAIALILLSCIPNTSKHHLNLIARQASL